MKKNTSEKTKTTKKSVASKSTKKSASKAKVKRVSKKKSTLKRKDDVEDFTFEERAFQNDKKKKIVKEVRKVNIIPALIGLLCVALVLCVMVLVKNDKFSLMETKKIETISAKPTETQTEKVEKTTMAEKKIEADINTLKRELPYYDIDIYSEGAMYSYDKELLQSVQKEMENLINDSAYGSAMSEGKKNIIYANKNMLDSYLDNYNKTDKKDYDSASKKDYMSDVINGAKEKKGKFYYSDFVAVSLFADAKDKGLYYEIPSSFYKKITIKKYAFDKMAVGAKGSISLPFGENDALVATEVIKEDDSTVSYIDKEGKEKRLELVGKSDFEYALKDGETGGYVVTLYFNDNICVLKDARVGHGKDMEYVAYNYLKYPTDINFEVYVKAEDIVNKTSTNNMLNSQWINSSKQVWDEKGFVVSLVYFE